MIQGNNSFLLEICLSIGFNIRIISSTSKITIQELQYSDLSAGRMINRHSVPSLLGCSYRKHQYLSALEFNNRQFLTRKYNRQCYFGLWALSFYEKYNQYSFRDEHLLVKLVCTLNISKGENVMYLLLQCMQNRTALQCAHI